jgi:transmembrane sensor
VTRPEITDEAVEWLIALETSRQFEEHWPAFFAWLNQSPEHRSAYLAVERAWRAAVELKDLLPPEAQRSPKAMLQAALECYQTRRLESPRWIQLRLACAMLIGALVMLPGISRWLPSTQHSQYSRYSTDIGQEHTVILPDGSMIALDTDTQLSARMDLGTREVVLETGRALITVKHEVARPFTVSAGQIAVRAMGAMLSIRKTLDGAVEVVVTHGSAVVIQAGSRSILIRAGQKATLRPNAGSMVLREASVTEREISWSKGVLTIDGTLAEVVDEINRYNRRKLEIADPLIARFRIFGQIRGSDPEVFAEMLKVIYGIQHTSVESKSSDNRVIVLRAANGGPSALPGSRASPGAERPSALVPQGSLWPSRKTQFPISTRNLLNQIPPFLTDSAEQIGYDPVNSNLQGRRLLVGLRVKW